MTHHTPPRPTSSPPRPPARDDLTQSTSSLVPHPFGDEVDLSRRRRPTKTTAPARPRDDLTDELDATLDLMDVS
jgi:hypothetical protein